MRVAWFSSGCSSFVAACYGKPDRIVYIDVANQHPDSMRFLRDAEKVLRREIEIIKSSEYASVDDVRERDNLTGDDVYIWGYDVNEKRRADRISAAQIEARNEFPLIERNLTKAECHAICAKLGLKRPVMYDMGYPKWRWMSDAGLPNAGPELRRRAIRPKASLRKPRASLPGA